MISNADCLLRHLALPASTLKNPQSSCFYSVAKKKGRKKRKEKHPYLQQHRVSQLDLRPKYDCMQADRDLASKYSHSGRRQHAAYEEL